MWKRKIKKCLALGLAFAMMTGVAGLRKYYLQKYLV